MKRSWKQHLSVVERWGKNIQLNGASGKNELWSDASQVTIIILRIIAIYNIWTCLEHGLQWITPCRSHQTQASHFTNIDRFRALSDIALLSGCLWFRCGALTPEFIFLNSHNVFHHHSTPMAATEVLISSLSWTCWSLISSLQLRSQRWTTPNWLLFQLLFSWEWTLNKKKGKLKQLKIKESL